jgi:methionyl-tRNA formyltransferase
MADRDGGARRYGAEEYKAVPTGNQAGAVPGTIVGTDAGIEVACRDGTVVVTEVQASGGGG